MVGRPEVRDCVVTMGAYKMNDVASLWSVFRLGLEYRPRTFSNVPASNLDITANFDIAITENFSSGRGWCGSSLAPSALQGTEYDHPDASSRRTRCDMARARTHGGVTTHGHDEKDGHAHRTGWSAESLSRS